MQQLGQVWLPATEAGGSLQLYPGAPKLSKIKDFLWMYFPSFFHLAVFWYICNVFTPTLPTVYSKLFSELYFIALSNIVLLSGGNSEWQAEVQVDWEGEDTTERKNVKITE